MMDRSCALFFLFILFVAAAGFFYVPHSLLNGVLLLRHWTLSAKHLHQNRIHTDDDDSDDDVNVCWHLLCRDRTHTSLSISRRPFSNHFHFHFFSLLCFYCVCFSCFLLYAIFLVFPCVSKKKMCTTFASLFSYTTVLHIFTNTYIYKSHKYFV